MGLLDEYLLRGKPKLMPLEASKGFDPTAAMGMTAGDELDPFGGARRAEALEVRGAAPPNIPGGTLAGPNQQRAFAAGDRPYGPQTRNLGIAQADAAPPKTNLAEMNFGLGDNFPAPKNPARLAEGNPMQPPEPEPSSGLLSNKPAIPASSPMIVQPKPPMPTAFAERAPLPPPRSMLGGSSPAAPARVAAAPPPAPAMPPPRPPEIGNMAGLPQSAPMPPVRPPELGGIDTASLTPPAPIADTPIIGMGGDTAVGAADAAAASPAAAAGGGDILGGILGAAGGLAKMFAGKKAPAPQAKAPQLSPSNAGATVDAEIAQDRAKAPQILAGLLADNPKRLIDPRKQRRA